MKIERTAKEPTVIKLHISAGSQDLEPIKLHVLGHFARQAKIPGFRAGKAPAHLLEKNIDQKALLDEFMEHALNDLYAKALDDQKIRPISQPKAELKKFVPYSLLEFEAELEIIGPIGLPDYKKIKMPKPKVSVTSKDVDEVIDSLRFRQAERVSVARPAKKGDEVVIDFTGTDEANKPLAGAAANDYKLILGSGSFIPGFEDQIVKMKPDEAKSFDVTFPANYSVTGLRNKPVTFKVKLKQLNELKLPELNDKFAGTIGPFKTVSELRADIKKQLTLERQNQSDRDYENELVKEIVSRAKFDVPNSLVNEQITRMEDEEKRNLVYQGQTWQEHLKTEGVTEEQHRQRQRPQAEERVKGGLVLSEIADKEKIQVSPEEMEIRLQVLKGQYQDPQMRAELDKPENRQDIASRLLTEKTLAKLVSYAKS
jgi:trigger factor